ncbi:hypothetical protein A2U01_0098538, partial [Trifolium medium]|nr:hypothetical protein [Trifolium medium]
HKRQKASKVLKVHRCSDRKRLEKLELPKIPGLSERKRRTLQESENPWLKREKATEALLARWKARWARKP